MFCCLCLQWHVCVLYEYLPSLCFCSCIWKFITSKSDSGSSLWMKPKSFISTWDKATLLSMFMLCYTFGENCWYFSVVLQPESRGFRGLCICPYQVDHHYRHHFQSYFFSFSGSVPDISVYSFFLARLLHLPNTCSLGIRLTIHSRLTITEYGC